MAKFYAQKYKRFLVLMLLAVTVTGFSVLTGRKALAKPFHTNEERAKLMQMLSMQTLPTDTNGWFSASGKCAGCHGHDPAGVAFVTSWGEDVNIADDWAGTMMANSAKDPLWRAKVSHEILVNPGLQQTIENTCTRCHAPTGRFSAEYYNQLPYSIATMEQDSMAMDGVNCSACHQQKDTLQGRNFSGDLHYTKKIFYGPYTNPFAGPMHAFNGFTPEYSAHITKATLCGSCHSLIVHTHDLSGNPTGQDFVEQATYHEWLNSSYADTTTSGADRTCQSCHVPRINDPVDIATNYPFLASRSPFGKHHLVGGNAFMLKLIRNNMNAVGATCDSMRYDTTIARTTRQLRDSTLSLVLTENTRTSDSVFYDLQLNNKCGHKFPSGYPSRIAWVEFTVIDDNGDTLFKSGLLDGNGDLIGRDATYEPHFDYIYDGEQQVQVYEMVQGDVNQNVTTVLERADTALKDNRLAPLGFKSTHFAYDTCRVAGGALNDPDFNRNGATEGTGSDIVHYHVNLNGYSGALHTTARVWYQSVPRRFLDEMFQHNSTEITAFQNMFNASDRSPNLVGYANLGGVLTSVHSKPVDKTELTVYPVPTADGRIFIVNASALGLRMIKLYDLSGQLVMTQRVEANFDGWMTLPREGVFIIRAETNDKRTYTRRVMYYY